MALVRRNSNKMNNKPYYSIPKTYQEYNTNKVLVFTNVGISFHLLCENFYNIYIVMAQELKTKTQTSQSPL